MRTLTLLTTVAICVQCQTTVAANPKPECVGYASVDTKNNIHLNLLSSDASHGGAMLLIDKKHPLYEQVRKHVGELRPRKWKCVKPWADEKVGEQNNKAPESFFTESTH
jgi:hypothetical protein